MKVARARIAKQVTADGLYSTTAQIGKMYEVDLDRIYRGMPLVDKASGRAHAKDMVMCQEQSSGLWGWAPLELLEVEVARGFEKA